MTTKPQIQTQALNFLRVLPKNMAIVTLTDTLLQKHPAQAGAIGRESNTT
jgi:hypothetical protein